MTTLKRLCEPSATTRRICLMLEEGNMTQYGLTRRLGRTKGAVSKCLTALRAGGYVVRVGKVATCKGTTFEYARTALPLPEPGRRSGELPARKVAAVIDAMVRSAR